MEQRKASTFGNFSRPARPGIWGLGVVGTAVVVGGMLLAALSFFFSFWVTAVIGGITLIALGLLAGRYQDKNFGQRLVRRVAWFKGRRARRHIYRSGLTAAVPSLSHRLPGLAAASVLHTAHDSYQRPYALVEHPHVGHFAVVLRCEPDGAALVDQATVEQRVAGYADYLAALADEPGIVAATVTVESTPDPGTRLTAEIGRLTRPDAPELARSMMREIHQTYPAGGAALRVTATVVYSPAMLRHGNPDVQGEDLIAAIRQELGTRVPLLCARLSDAGGGAVAPLPPVELAELVRAAYDPHAEAFIAQARLTPAGSGVTWENAGPVAAEAAWTVYRHDGALSRTWSMWDAPRGQVLANVMQRLLDAHPDVPRKRVTLIYRPYLPSEAIDQVERDVRDALFAQYEDSGTSARIRMRVRAAEQTADEEARGAGLARFSLLVTATTGGREEMRSAASTIDALAGRIQLRPCFGAQDSAFAACLPIGVILPYYTATPTILRDAL